MAFFLMASSVYLIVNTFLAKLLRQERLLTTCKIQFDSDVKAMAIKLNGRSWFPQVTWFYTLYPLLAIICCWYITSLSIKVNFYKYGLYYTWVQMLLQIGPLLRLGSKCYYGWDFYYAWVQMLLHMGPLLHLGPTITLVPSSPRNDPQPWNDPQIDPKWYRPRNGLHFSSRWPRNDPQLILGMELVFRRGIITNLLQRLRS